MGGRAHDLLNGALKIVKVLAAASLCYCLSVQMTLVGDKDNVEPSRWLG